MFGASGFVGSHIVKRALQCGPWKVVGACRSGKPQNADQEWCKDVQWAAVDATAPSSIAKFFEQHSNPAAVVSAIGAPLPAYEKSLMVNGTTNVNVFTAARDLASAPKLVFVSAEHNPVFANILRGSYDGKRRVEELLEKTAAKRYAVMRPGLIYSGGLSAIGIPMEYALRPLHKLTGFGIFSPAIHVERLASAVLRGM